MIRLDIQKYCEACCDFEPNVIKPERDFIGRDDGSKIVCTQTDTIVRCKYAKRCEAIKRYLENNSTKG